MDIPTFIAGAIGTGLVIRFVAQGIGAVVAFLWALVRSV